MKRITVAFEGLTMAGELFDDRAPRLCQAIWDALPLEGSVTNVTWSGEMLRLWVTIPEPAEPENVVPLQNPGEILFVPGWNGLRFLYGPAQMRGPRGPHPVPRVGRLIGDLTEFVRQAKRVEWEGAKTMRVDRA
ncbi:MAG TPA: DUF3830 family protein [Methylomirabilota bacterium]|nr:DUF3830 family protein [Methylomirabilota bacterium]